MFNEERVSIPPVFLTPFFVHLTKLNGSGSGKYIRQLIFIFITINYFNFLKYGGQFAIYPKKK
jgi:hypothetical protein